MVQDMQDQMVRSFWEQAGAVLSGIPESGSGLLNHVGAEIEVYLAKQGTGINGIPTELASVDLTQQVISETLEAGSELGGGSVELNPPPLRLETSLCFENLLRYLKFYEDTLRGRVREYGLEVRRSGTIPDVRAQNLLPATKDKYTKVPDFHRAKHFGFWGHLNGVDLRDPMVIGLCHAFQINVEAASQEEAVDVLNRMFVITPMALALGHNARYLHGRDTGFADVRNIAWRISHDTRSWKGVITRKYLRVGLPQNYFRNMEHYLSEVASYPFILNHPEAALAIGIGLFWRDARIKFIKGVPVVEFRPLSTQPTLRKEIALTAFVLGRLYWSIDCRERLSPMSKIRKLKRTAECYGFFPKIKMEICRAKAGLAYRALYDEGVGRLLDTLL